MRPTSGFCVRLGRLDGSDFGLLDSHTCARLFADPESKPLLGPALGGDPLTLHRLSRACPGLADRAWGLAGTAAGPAERDRCRGELVRRWCLELLRAKAPPLYDALPWFELDLAPLLREFRPWRSQVMLTGNGAPALLFRFPRTAGATVVEPVEPVARYCEQRVKFERIRNARVARTPLEELAPTTRPFDLALCGWPPFAAPGPALERICAAARTAALLEFGPAGKPPDAGLLARLGFEPLELALADGTPLAARVRRA